MNIKVKDFSMPEFLAWLDENNDKIDGFNLDKVGVLAHCNVRFKDDRFDVLPACHAMGVKEAHEKVCDVFGVDKSRKITKMNITIACDEVPRLTITELKVK